MLLPRNIFYYLWIRHLATSRRQYKQTEIFLASGGDIDDTAEPRFSPMLSAGKFTVVGLPLSLWCVLSSFFCPWYKTWFPLWISIWNSNHSSTMCLKDYPFSNKLLFQLWKESVSLYVCVSGFRLYSIPLIYTFILSALIHWFDD